MPAEQSRQHAGGTSYMNAALSPRGERPADEPAVEK
jgi:hypothetical protein